MRGQLNLPRAGGGAVSKVVEELVWAFVLCFRYCVDTGKL